MGAGLNVEEKQTDLIVTILETQFTAEPTHHNRATNKMAANYSK